MKGQAEDKETDNELKLLEYIENQTFAEDYDPNQPRDIGGKWTKGIQYYSKLPKELREKIKNSSKEVREAVAFAMLGKPVKQLTGNEFQKDDIKLTDKVPAYYQEKYGGKVANKEIGEVMLDLEGVQDDIGHHLSKLKCCAFAAVPEVVMNGKIFDRQKNWKKRGYDSYVIIAPVKIGTQRYIEEVVVKRNNKRQGFYLHEVEIKKRLEDFIKTHTEVGHLPTSRLIIAQKIKKVK